MKALECGKCGVARKEQDLDVVKVSDGPSKFWGSTALTYGEELRCPDCGYSGFVEINACVACASVGLIVEAAHGDEICEECTYNLDEMHPEPERTARQKEQLRDAELEILADIARGLK